MGIHTVFPESDLEAIRRATAAGERRSGGEIVPYIVERVVGADEVRWPGATLGALGAALVAGLVHAFGDYWGGLGVWWITLPTIVGAGAGYFVAGLDAVGRRLIPEDRVDRAVEMRARVVEAEAQVPVAMAVAFRSGNLGVMRWQSRSG